MTWITVGTVTVFSRFLENTYILKSHPVFVEPEFLLVKLGTFTDMRMLVQRNECNIKILQQMGTRIELGFFCCLFVF